MIDCFKLIIYGGLFILIIQNIVEEEEMIDCFKLIIYGGLFILIMHQISHVQKDIAKIQNIVEELANRRYYDGK